MKKKHDLIKNIREITPKGSSAILSLIEQPTRFTILSKKYAFKIHKKYRMNAAFYAEIRKQVLKDALFDIENKTLLSTKKRCPKCGMGTWKPLYKNARLRCAMEQSCGWRGKE